MNITTADHHLLAGASYMLFSMFGLILYIPTVLVFYFGRKKLCGAFYVIISHVAVADIGCLSVAFFILGPCSLNKSAVYGQLTTEILANFNTLFFYSLLCSMFLMTINRTFACFPYLTLNAKFFKGTSLHLLACGCWLAAAVNIVLTNLCCCRKIFDPELLIIRFDCDLSKTAAVVVSHFLTLVSLGEFCVGGVHLSVCLFDVSAKIQRTEALNSAFDRSSTLKTSWLIASACKNLHPTCKPPHTLCHRFG